MLRRSQGRRRRDRFVFQLNDHDYLVEEVVDQWYGPEHAFFKLRAEDGNLYIILRHQTSVPNGEWELVAFRETELAMTRTVPANFYVFCQSTCP